MKCVHTFGTGRHKRQADITLLFQYINPKQKRDVMWKAANLKYISEGLAQERLKKISACHDISKAEGQVNKLKLSEAKLKTANNNQDGKFVYKVRECSIKSKYSQASCEARRK